MAVWWPVWRLVLCLVGRGDWDGACGFWLGVLLVVVWRLSFLGPVSPGLFVLWSGVIGVGTGAGQQMLFGFGAFWHVGRGVGSCGGIGSGGCCCCVIGGGSSGRDSGCIRVWSWLLWLAGAGWAWGWGLGGSLGGCRRLPVYYILLYSI